MRPSSYAAIALSKRPWPCSAAPEIVPVPSCLRKVRVRVRARVRVRVRVWVRV